MNILTVSYYPILSSIVGGLDFSFKDEYTFFQRKILIEKIIYIYQCESTQIPLGDVLSLVG